MKQSAFSGVQSGDENEFTSAWYSTGLGPALVAITWFWICSASIPETLRAILAGALFVVVGLIYFFDRVWDRRRHAASLLGQQSFARRGTMALAGIFLGLTLIFGLGVSMSEFIPKELRLVGVVFECACSTVAYYLAKDGLARWNAGRALIVAWIFWRGVTGPGLAWSQTFPGAAEIGLLLLFIANALLCLRGFPASWKTTSFWVTWTGISPLLGWFVGMDQVHIALAGSISAFLLGLVGIFACRSAHVKLVVMADMAIWLPPLVCILWQSFA